jgi:septum formation protein
MKPSHMEPPQIVLASASPRRSQLLHQLGVSHCIEVADVDESPRSGEDPGELALRLAGSKALAVAARLAAASIAANDESRPGQLPILAADTVVVLDRQLFGKPRDRDDALAMLAMLSGRSHRVLSAVALCNKSQLTTRLSESEVRFRELSHEECERYWQTGEPADKAGAYGIQGYASAFVAELRGSYSGVMGLPLYDTSLLLHQAGVAIWQGRGV